LSPDDDRRDLNVRDISRKNSRRGIEGEEWRRLHGEEKERNEGTTLYYDRKKPSGNAEIYAATYNDPDHRAGPECMLRKLQPAGDTHRKDQTSPGNRKIRGQGERRNRMAADENRN